MAKKILATLTLLALAGCASQISLSLRSEPDGARITQNGKQVASVIYYKKSALELYKRADNCYAVKGFQAVWVSGAVDDVKTITLCGEKDNYYFVFERPNHEGLDKDLDFALKTKQLKLQEQTVNLQRQANSIAIMNSVSPKNCQTTYIGGYASTQCF